MAQDPASSSAESPPSRSRCWRFASTVFDERTLELTVDGEPVDIERKPSEVLLYLLLHAGEVVTKDELLEAVWPRRILTETALTKCIARLREALGDADQTIIKTLYGLGYRFIAPVRVEASAVPAAPRFDFAPGDALPSRPHWKLVRRLGGGSHGEAWLAQHEKTAEQRVFKFALDASALVSLKREITLFRLLNDTLDERSPAVRLLDWNLEQPPCFIEAEYIDGGSLTDWIGTQGGFAKIPLAQRIELAAQIADALAAAHSVGVLHKDLKPPNIFIGLDDDGRPHIKLGDFGSGGIIDPDRLDALHITRLGFTGTLHAGEVTGTLTYLAPEVLAGQPSTVQTDIYALGVILYQLVVGDLQRPLAPGWERDVDDELLREDIAATADIDPARRLGDAGELARRLRALDDRRLQRDAERDALAAAECAREEARQAKQEAERMRARRTGTRIALGVLLAALIISSILFFDAREARQHAESEAVRASAVSDFLNNDVLSVVSSGDAPVKDLTVKQLLDSASQQADKRFANQPDIAARVDLSLGKSYYWLEAERDADDRFAHGLSILEKTGAADEPLVLDLTGNRIDTATDMGTLPEFMPHAQAVLDAGQVALGATHPAVLRLRSNVAAAYLESGRWATALDEYEHLLNDTQQASPADDRALGNIHFDIGWTLGDLAEYASAEQELRKAQSILTPLLGDKSLEIAKIHLALGGQFVDAGRYSDGEAELGNALRVFRRWEKDDRGEILGLKADLARSAFYQDRLDDAEREFHEVLNVLQSWQTGERDQSAEIRESLALIAGRRKEWLNAIETMRDAIQRSVSSYGSSHPQTRRMRVELIDVLLQAGQLATANAEFDVGPPLNFDDLPPQHPLRAALLRVQGLLAAQEHRDAEARKLIDESAKMFNAQLGPKHWLTRRALNDLSLLDEPAR